MLLKINTSNTHYNTQYGIIYVNMFTKRMHKQSQSITIWNTGSNYGTSSTTRQVPKQCERCRSFCTRYKLPKIIYGKNMVQFNDKIGQPRIGKFISSVILYQKKPIVKKMSNIFSINFEVEHSVSCSKTLVQKIL